MMLCEVHNHRDKAPANPPELLSSERPIQAGAALTRERTAPLTDDIGMNISVKNKQYCEMSATYWVWKNTAHAWKGIEHYRRHLLARPEQLCGGVDVVLPLPYLCYLNTTIQFRRFVSEEVFQGLVQPLQVLHQRRLEDYRSVFYGQYQHTYNLVCARSDVFDAYCRRFLKLRNIWRQWRMKSRRSGTHALSYVAEVLTNLYFMTSGWNISYVDKVFIHNTYDINSVKELTSGIIRTAVTVLVVILDQ